MMEFRCPECGEALSVPSSLAGQTKTCPGCGNVVAVPGAGAQDTEPGRKGPAADDTAGGTSAVGLYNRGVALYRKGEYVGARAAFDQCFQTGEYRMQSAYAAALCQKEMGLEVRISEELGDRAEDAGPVYVASNVACYLIEKGHRAALTKEGSTSEVAADIDGARYVFQVSSLFGGFNNWVTRIDGQKTISVPDPTANPNPTKTDRFAISLAEKASSLPPSPLPEDGLPEDLRAP